MMERLYITLKQQYDSESIYNELTGKWEHTRTELEPLAFGSACNKSGNFNEKRMETQRDWAYGQYKIINGEVFETGNRYDYNKQIVVHVTNQLAKYQPQIIDNIPIAGFKIEKIATRWRTANKLFRVSDPRGFEFEITAQNLLELMNSCIIDKGEVRGKCKWDFGKNGIGKAKLIWVCD